MVRNRKRLAWLVGAGSVAAGAALLLWQYSRSFEISMISGAVLREDADVQKQISLSNVIVSTEGLATKTDALGTFRIPLHPPLVRGQHVTLKFQHSGYEPLQITETADNRIYIFRLKPKPRAAADTEGQPAVLANVRVRYAINNVVTQNVGSTNKTLTIANKGNVPCDGKSPCSPDGKWLATLGWASLDAGDGNELWNPRVSCIAGPCAFTKVEYENSSKGGRIFDVSVRNWSDTATFVLEAEVAHTMSNETIRRSYPVTLGPTMSFTMPLDAQGLSIEAELDGQFIVFPLGPNLRLSWADCNAKSGINQTKLYRCQLKAGYKFSD